MIDKFKKYLQNEDINTTQRDKLNNIFNELAIKRNNYKKQSSKIIKLSTLNISKKDVSQRNSRSITHIDNKLIRFQKSLVEEKNLIQKMQNKVDMVRYSQGVQKNNLQLITKQRRSQSQRYFPQIQDKQRKSLPRFYLKKKDNPQVQQEEEKKIILQQDNVMDIKQVKFKKNFNITSDSFYIIKQNNHIKNIYKKLDQQLLEQKQPQKKQKYVQIKLYNKKRLIF